MPLSSLAWVLIVIAAIVVLYFIITYNRIIQMENRIDNNLGQIDVQLKRRADLIPNLMEAVKGYMKHEKNVMADVTKARKAMMSAKTPEGKLAADNMLEGALKSIFALSENYPQLRASENFQQLQEELSGTESKIAFSRQHYNDTVNAYNNIIESFPSTLIAKMMGRREEKEMLQIEAKERKNVKVKF